MNKFSKTMGDEAGKDFTKEIAQMFKTSANSKELKKAFGEITDFANAD
jgi:hypothetical protein